jgi:hypothetical protein
MRGRRVRRRETKPRPKLVLWLQNHIPCFTISLEPIYKVINRQLMSKKIIYLGTKVNSTKKKMAT